MIVLAEIVLAAVAYHVPFSEDANKPEYWCKNGTKIEPVDGKIWTIDGKYDKVIIKAGAGEYANTVYIRPQPGMGAYSDTNGNFRFDPSGPGSDQAISHVIVCPVEGVSPSPSPSTSSPSPTPTTTPTESVTPTPTETPSPTPTVPDASEEKQRGVEDYPPVLAETGSSTSGTGAVGIALILLGWALTHLRRE